jgi:hypothetical protein
MGPHPPTVFTNTKPMVATTTQTTQMLQMVQGEEAAGQVYGIHNTDHDIPTAYQTSAMGTPTILPHPPAGSYSHISTLLAAYHGRGRSGRDPTPPLSPHHSFVGSWEPEPNLPYRPPPLRIRARSPPRSKHPPQRRRTGSNSYAAVYPNRHTIEGPLHHHRQGHGSLAPREEEGDYDSASDGSSHRVSRADTDPQQSCHRACVCRTGWDQAPNPVQLRPLGSSHGGRIPPGASNPRQRHQRPPAQDLLRYSLGDSHLGPLAQALGQDVSTLLPHEPAAAAHLGTGE